MRECFYYGNYNNYGLGYKRLSFFFVFDCGTTLWSEAKQNGILPLTNIIIIITINIVT